MIYFKKFVKSSKHIFGLFELIHGSYFQYNLLKINQKESIKEKTYKRAKRKLIINPLLSKMSMRIRMILLQKLILAKKTKAHQKLKQKSVLKQLTFIPMTNYLSPYKKVSRNHYVKFFSDV